MADAPIKQISSAARGVVTRVVRLGRTAAGALTVRQSAALPYRVSAGRVQVLLVTSRRSGRWIIPKGHVERGLSPNHSAAKEAMEEAGVVGHVGRSPVGRYAYHKRGLGHHVEVYDLRVRRELSDWPERGQRRREWVGVNAAVRRVGNEELRGVIAGLPGRVGRRVVSRD
jgi:8-oxo-dGTP pyrophosphatase MutT (NUDIX family)